jgi:cupin 2 domain-containing protein
MSNLLTNLPDARTSEIFTELLSRPGIRLERIVSQGQATPQDVPMVQDEDEWVVLLAGEAGLRIEDGAEVRLAPGNSIFIAAGQRHWVTFTAKDRPTVWLALHLG